MPNGEIFLVILNMFVALISAGFNIAYYFTHTNGKKSLRLLVGLLLLYFGFIYAVAAAGFLPLDTFGAEYFRWLMWVLFFIPMWDARIDWDKNK